MLDSLLASHAKFDGKSYQNFLHQNAKFINETKNKDQTITRKFSCNNMICTYTIDKNSDIIGSKILVGDINEGH